MIGRLVKGLVLGLLMGGGLAGILIKGLGITTFAVAGGGFAFSAFSAAMVTGALAGLLAGKPIWAEGAWIEGILKTVFGALLGAGAMFLARKFGGMEFPLPSLGLGAGNIGDLPIVTLPAIATLLSVFYELDNTDSAESTGTEAKGRVAGKAPAVKLRAPASVGSSLGEADDDAVAPAKRAKK
jgi:hypothetical protein